MQPEPSPDESTGPDATGPAAPAEALAVRLGGSAWGLPLACVAEVGRPPGTTRVPGLPAWVPGVANWRGRVLAVLDLRPLLGVPAPALTRSGRLVVLTRGEVRVGLLTEAVEGTAPLDPDRLEPVPPTLPPQAAALLQGCGPGPGGALLAVLDPAAVLALADALPRPRKPGAGRAA